SAAPRGLADWGHSPCRAPKLRWLNVMLHRFPGTSFRHCLLGFVFLAGCRSTEATTPSDAEVGGEVDAAAPVVDSGPPPPPSTWNWLGGDHGSTYHNVNERTLSRENASQLKAAHVIKAYGAVNGAPIVVDNRIFALAAGEFQCFDANTGAQ